MRQDEISQDSLKAKKKLAEASVSAKILSKEDAEKTFGVSLDNNFNYPSFTEGFFVYSNKRMIPQYTELSEYFSKEIGFYSYNQYEHIFNGKNWEYAGPDLVKNRILKLTKDQSLPSVLRNFYEILRVRCSLNNDVMSGWDNFTGGHINLKNGVLRVKDRVLLAHSKDFHFKYCLKYDFDRDAKCPKFLEYLRRGFNGSDELVDTYFEALGYCLEGGHPWAQVAIILSGAPNSGKSTNLAIVEEICGADNCSRVALDDLDDKFMPHTMNGKLCNIVDELPEHGINSEKFKTIVTGGVLSAQEKGKPIYKMPVTSRLIIAANGYLKFTTTQNLEALSRRQLYLPFNNPIKVEDVRHNIVNEMKAELSGILNMALDGLERLKKRGRFIKSEDSKKMVELFEIEQDSVFDWAYEKFNLSLDNKNELSFKLHYSKYVDEMKSQGRATYSYRKFCAKFRDILIKKFGKESVHDSRLGWITIGIFYN